MVKLTSTPIPQSFFDKRDNTVVTWLGMAGVLVNARGTIIFIDPLLTLIQKDGQLLNESGHKMIIDLPIKSSEVPRADVVCYTHDEGDHFMEPTALEFGKRLNCAFLSTPPVLKKLRASGAPVDKFITAKDFETHRFGNCEITVTPALHDWFWPNPWQRGDCAGYLIKTPDGTIWHPGDTRLIPELLEFRNVDVLFFDIFGGEETAHLGTKGSARLAETSGAKIMVAFHYGTFDLPAGSYGGCDPNDSLPYVKGLSGVFLQPTPGEILELPMARGHRAVKV